MNHHLTTDHLPPPPPFQPPRSSFTCDRHHNDTFTGFCPSCLSERLTTATVTDLRRTKSFSVSNTIPLPFLEPQRKSCDVNVNNLSSLFRVDDLSLNDLEDEIVEMEAKIDEIVDNLKSFNVDSNIRKSNFWATATKKLKKWRKKCNGGVVLTTGLPVNKYRETQSEVGDYGYGRRSCDIDTGLNRVLFDKPRASWDGYMIGRSFPRLNVNLTQRSDMTIPVEEPVNLRDCIPGGPIQTREYYLDSSSGSKRRKSLDRSNSINKMNEGSNSKVSPGIMDYNHVHCRSRFHSIGGENELGTNFSSELFNKEKSKKSRWWSWKVLGFSKRKASSNGDNAKLSRSSTSVSWRNMKSNSIENNCNNRRNGDEFVYERNASARYSPNHVNEGLLRFYLTPLRLRGSRQRSGTGTGTGKSRLF